MPKAWRAYEMNDPGLPLCKIFEEFVERVIVSGIQSRHIPCPQLSKLCPDGFAVIVHLTCQESPDVLNGDSGVGTQRGVRIHRHGFGLLRLFGGWSRSRCWLLRVLCRSWFLDVSRLDCHRICSDNLANFADHFEILSFFEVCLELNFDFHWLDDF
nr:MAG TPA: hypothetical protein [Caudoviricetes sp.]